MKKITIIASHLEHGGIEQAIASVTSMLIKKVDIEVVALYKTSEKPAFKIDDKVKIKYLIDSSIPRDIKTKGIKYFIKNFKFLTILKAIYIKCFLRNKVLKNYVSKSSSDIVISTHLFMNKSIKNFKGYKVCWEHNHHNNDYKFINKVKSSSKYINELVVVNDNIRKFYEDIFKEDNINVKVTFIPNFIEINNTKYSKLNTKNLLAVGRLEEEKGFLDLIDIMNILVKKDNEITLNLVGDGSLYNEIKTKIKTLNLEKNIIMHGFLSREKINDLTLVSSLYLMTSFKESFGLVVLEAASFKVPTITFDSAKGVVDLIENKKNGYVIKSRNKEKYASQVMNLLNNKEELELLGEEANKIIFIYSKEENEKYWLNLINGVVNE